LASVKASLRAFAPIVEQREVPKKKIEWKLITDNSDLVLEMANPLSASRIANSESHHRPVSGR
jgi:hypothetical protein